MIYIIIYLMLGTLFEMIHLKDIERAFTVKRIDNPFEIVLIMGLLVIVWPYFLYPPANHYTRRNR